jgi:hypothetical protein
MGTEAYYLVDEKEAELLAVVLDAGDPHSWGPTDQILCDLIEMGLVNMDRGPAVFQAWRDAAAEEARLTKDAMIHLYLHPDDSEDES